MEKISGIYCFENIIDEKKYIGQAYDIFNREKEHIKLLNHEKYDDSPYFQNAWSLYGDDNFKFYIVEKCPIELLNEKEIYYIKELRSHFSENGYNISWGGESFNRGLKISEETRKKMSESHKNMSEETRKKMRENHPDTSGENHPLWGKHPSEETKKKQSESHMAHSLSEETKNKISKALRGNTWNAKLTEEYVLEIKKMIYNGMRNIDIMKVVGVSQTNISRIRHEKNWGWLKYDPSE